MSSIGKPVNIRPTSESNNILLSNNVKVPSALLPSTSQVNEFVCTCATGWSGSTCEISKCFNCNYYLQIIVIVAHEEYCE